MSEEYDAYNSALQLSEDTIRGAQEAVARNEPLKEYLRESGAGNNTDVIRNFAQNPDADPVENLGPIHGQIYARKQRQPLGPKPNASPAGQSFGAWVMGKHL